MQVVRLCWRRLPDPAIRLYRVVRVKDRPPTADDPPIAEVRSPDGPTYHLVRNEVLTAIGPRVFKTALFPMRLVRLYLNGEPIGPPYDVSVEEDSGRIVVVPQPHGVLSADYEFDGIELFDAPLYQGEAVRYFGPPPSFEQAVPVAPVAIRVTAHEPAHELVVSWLPGRAPASVYHYAVFAVDAGGNASRLSDSVQVEAALTDSVRYLVEAETEPERWVPVTDVETNWYVTATLDRTAPHPVSWFVASGETLSGEGKGRVVLAWGPSPGDRPGPTPRLRVRQKIGQAVSSPSPAASPVTFVGRLWRYRIRRKVFDGALPSATGPDAQTVAEAPVDRFEATDEPPDRTVWQYAIFAVDEAGNASDPLGAVVEIADATPPPAVTNLRAERVPLVV